MDKLKMSKISKYRIRNKIPISKVLKRLFGLLKLKT